MEKKPTFYWIRSNVKEKDNVAIGESPLEKNYRCVSHAIYFSSVSPIYWRPRWITWHLLSAISLLRVRKNIPLFFIGMITFIPSPDIFGFSPLADTTVFFHVVSSFPSVRLFSFFMKRQGFLFPPPLQRYVHTFLHTQRGLWMRRFIPQSENWTCISGIFSVDVRVGAAVVVGREKFSVKMSDHKKREKI